MRVTLDNNEVQAATPTLAEGLRLAVAAAEDQGRVVIEASLDGHPLTDEQLTEPPDSEIPGSELNLISADPKSLVRSTLYDAADVLEESRQRHARAADLIQTGQTEDAMDVLSEVLTVWQAVRDVVDQGGELLGQPFESLDESGSLSTDIKRLVTCLSEVKRCLNVQDWATLSDVLAFDLDELGESWKKQLTSIADQIRQQ